MATKKETEAAIIVEDVHKAFKLPHENHSGLKQLVLSAFRSKKNKGYEIQNVLNGLSFTIEKGEFFGIVGRNGSGKSTLLKLLSGIYAPDQGAITVNGSLTPFIELGVGFNPELTGRENVYLNGALLGFSKKEMDAMYEDIVDFAEIHKFMDQKLKNYSSGMQVRLAFSIAIRAQSDILVLDEVLAVGDEAFQRKCSEYFANVRKTGKTIVLVTHDMNAVRKFCTTAMLIENGDIVAIGSPDDISNQYSIDNLNGSTTDQNKHSLGLSDLVPEFELIPVSKQVLSSNDTYEFDIKYKITEDIPVRIGMSLIDGSSGGYASIFDDRMTDNEGNTIPVSTRKGSYIFRYSIPLNRFNNRDFNIIAALFRLDKGDGESTPIAHTTEHRSLKFSIRGEEPDGGLLREKGHWVQPSK